MAKVRKKYQGPKYVARNPMVTFLGGMSNTHYEHLQTTNIINHAAMQAIVQGRADREDWNRVVGAINVAVVLSQMKIGLQYLDELLDAQDALLALGVRSVKADRFVLTGDEMRLINRALDIHDVQLEHCRAVDLDRAANEVIRRVRHKINGRSVMAELKKEASLTT